MLPGVTKRPVSMVDNSMRVLTFTNALNRPLWIGAVQTIWQTGTILDGIEVSGWGTVV